MAKEKIVLAYSGGLDTSAIIPWLKENYDCEVICVCGDVGQGKETDGLEEKALKTGASKLYIEDLTEEFITDAVYPCVKANAVYEGKYPWHAPSLQRDWLKLRKRKAQLQSATAQQARATIRFVLN